MVLDEGSKSEVVAKIDGGSTKLDILWKDKAIKLSLKIRLMRSLVSRFFFMGVKHGH